MLSFHPSGGIPVLTPGAVPVLAGMITEAEFLAIGAHIYMPTTCFRAAQLDVGHCPQVTGEHPIAEVRAVLGTITADDIRYFNHRATPVREVELEILHQLVY
jgi:hypothetical protein